MIIEAKISIIKPILLIQLQAPSIKAKLQDRKKE
jgi:hypothetical protein